MNAPVISFYLPCNEAQFARLPQQLQDYMPWQARETELNPYLGRFHWILQTYLHLRAAGRPVQLVHQVPDEGIVIGHVDSFPYTLAATPRRIVVPALVDKDIPIPHAALHITHNPVQGLRFGGAQRYLPPWPQIGLIPRDPARGDRFENLYFMGNREHLHPFFRSEAFTAHLQRLGVRLIAPDPSGWHNFSEADAVVAIRNFGRDKPHLERPALKLINAWRAHVPAILGYETAYRAEGRPSEDYLEASEEQALLAAIESLATQPELRARMAALGREAAARFTDEAICRHWCDLIDQDLIPRHAAWTQRAGYRLLERLMAGVRERLLWRYPAAFVERRLRD